MRMTLTVMVGILVMVSGASADLMVIDADSYADGTDISTLFDGVTLSAVGPYNGLDGSVYARTAMDSSLATTGSNVFGTNLLGIDSDGSPRSEVWYHSTYTPYQYVLRADLAEATDYVAIDIISNNHEDFGELKAYAADGTLLASVQSPGMVYGVPFTAEIVRATADIAYVIAGGMRSDTIYLDNLRIGIEAVPAPGAVLLGMVGLGMIGWVKRRAA